MINTANSKSVGEHWVAMRMTEEKCFYFDSFGLEILDENIKKIARIYNNVIYSERCIQNIQSEKCGEFCVAFVNNVHCVETYKSFINSVSDNIYINYFIINHFI